MPQEWYITPEEWLYLIPPLWWVIFGGGLIGLTVAVIAVAIEMGRMQPHRRCDRPLTSGKVDLFNEDGNFLSAKLSLKHLGTLINDVNRGRFG
jgi:hypothetical protein